MHLAKLELEDDGLRLLMLEHEVQLALAATSRHELVHLHDHLVGEARVDDAVRVADLHLAVELNELLMAVFPVVFAELTFP